MRHAMPLILLGSVMGCASLTPQGAHVKVYEADLAAPANSRSLPEGCRRLSVAGPIEQMESERHISDPYRIQRNETGERGGNVLLVLSSPLVTRAKLDCAPSDKSPECADRGQSWYRVSFESYACDEVALQSLARLEPATSEESGLWPVGKRKAPPPSPTSRRTPSAALSTSELKSKILTLMQEGLGTDVIAAYVRERRVATALTAEEIIDWKRAGIVDPVIEAAIAQAAASR
jgi:hypothetical protein